MRSCVAVPFSGLVLCLITAPPLTAQPEAYARHWPVQGDEAGIYAVTLTPELYGQIEHPDLSDLAAFNGAGEALGFEPLASVWKEPEARWSDALWFALPSSEADQGDALSVRIRRADDGSLSLRAQVGGSPTRADGGEVLVDTGIDRAAGLHLQALEFEIDPQVVDFSARLRIDASHDLETWRNLAAGASLLRLQRGEELLERRRIELPGPTERYLRLRRLEVEAPLPLVGLRVQARSAATVDPRPPELSSVAELVSRDGRVFIYQLPTRIAAEKLNLRWAEDNTVVVASLSSRESERQTWRPRGRLTAFRLRAEGVELDNEPLRLAPLRLDPLHIAPLHIDPLHLSGHRDRQWRVEVDRDLAEAPTLELSYRPERWLLLTRGAAPYVIAAGSTHARRETMPLAALLAPMRTKYGPEWQPTEATLGRPVIVSGDAATQASLGERWSGRVLWLVLIGSALAIASMVYRLMRPPSPAQTKAGSSGSDPGSKAQ